MKANINRQLVSVAKIFCGNLLLTATYALLTVPNGIINGGVTSFALSLSTFTGADVSVFSNAVTVLLIVSSLFLISREFCVKSILSSVLYMGLFTALHLSGISIDMHPLPASIIGGVLVGASYFLCIDADSSTAGFDVLAIAIHKRFPKTEVAVNLRVISCLVLLLGASALGILAVLYGLLFTLVETGVLKVLMRLSTERRQERGQVSAMAEEIV